MSFEKSSRIHFQRGPWLSALGATAVFILLTIWTKYPYLADDYYYAWKAYLPDFDFATFTNLVTRRPLSSVINFYSFRSHIFERSGFLFWAYFFLQSLSTIFVFRFLIRRWLPQAPTAWRCLFAVEILICLYPDLFENTLMALNLPYTLGISFLALALLVDEWSSLPVVKFLLQLILFYLSFCCLETWVLTALGLVVLSSVRPHFQRRAFLRWLTIWSFALITFLATEKLLAPVFGDVNYNLSLNFAQLFENFKTAMTLLWFHGFYKVNWVSTVLDFAATGILAFLLWRRNRLLLLALVLIPIGASAPQWLYSIYAPRSIHGAMILRVILTGLALMMLQQNFPRRWRWCFGLLLSAYLLNYAALVYNRSVNESIMSARAQQIEQTLRSCSEPCTIDESSLNQGLLWDWYLPDVFRPAFVGLIKARCTPYLFRR